MLRTLENSWEAASFPHQSQNLHGLRANLGKSGVDYF
jgi:hypothetical protein